MLNSTKLKVLGWKVSKSIIPIKRITEKNYNLVGGKAINLAKLMQIGHNVPDGFVVTINLYKKDLRRYSHQILKAFDNLRVDSVSVRSSANVEDAEKYSFAGQFETYLSVNKENLLSSIKSCQKSVNTERVSKYCKLAKIDPNEIKMAVVVQGMIEARVSGVCFTANPLNGNKNELVINAACGFGEGMVSGKITADFYVVDKLTSTILEKKFQKSQKLSDKNILILSRLCYDISKHYQYAIDIEWCFYKDKFHFLQVRPITGV